MSRLGGLSSKITKVEALRRGEHIFSSSVSDSDFLKQLKTATLDECLRHPAVEAEETAHACLTTQVDSLVAGFGQEILSMQKRKCDKQIQLEISCDENRELGCLRAGFVGQIEDLTRQRSRSYVLYSSRGMGDSLMQYSRTSIHIDNLATKKEHYYSPGSLASPFIHWRFLSIGQKPTLSVAVKRPCKAKKSNTTFILCAFEPSKVTISNSILPLFQHPV